MCLFSTVPLLLCTPEILCPLLLDWEAKGQFPSFFRWYWPYSYSRWNSKEYWPRCAALRVAHSAISFNGAGPQQNTWNSGGPEISPTTIRLLANAVMSSVRECGSGRPYLTFAKWWLVSANVCLSYSLGVVSVRYRKDALRVPFAVLRGTVDCGRILR